MGSACWFFVKSNHLLYILSQYVADSDDRNWKRIHVLQLLNWLDPQWTDINYSEEDQHLRLKFPPETLLLIKPRLSFKRITSEWPDLSNSLISNFPILLIYIWFFLKPLEWSRTQVIFAFLSSFFKYSSRFTCQLNESNRQLDAEKCYSTI